MNVGDRMKGYEDVARHVVSPRTPLIIRLDGRAFHSLTKKCERPFDSRLSLSLDETAMFLMGEIQNARMAYLQSDEISILLIDYNTFDSEQWFGGNVQKITSISASLASVMFSSLFGVSAVFDSRVVSLPEKEVVNYFVWRQQDWTRNSIQMVARSLYSHKELYGKNTDEMHDMIFSRGKNWNDCMPYWKRGRVVTKDGVDTTIPIFSQERDYIERFMEIEEE